MLPIPSASRSTSASVALGTAAPDASALPRRLSLPTSLPRASRFRILSESELNEEEGDLPEWGDARAVVFTHAADAGSSRSRSSSPVPAPAPAFPAAMIPPPEATSFPLLDDDGNVIVGLEMLPAQIPPVTTETSVEFGFPLGPLVWEPETEESTQICLETEGEIVWFSSSDIALTSSSSPLAREMVIPMAGVMSLPPTHVCVQGPPAFPASPTGSPDAATPRSAESVASILESLRAEAGKSGETLAVELHGGFPVAETPAITQPPLSFADWMLSTQQTGSSAPPANACGQEACALPPAPGVTLPTARQPDGTPQVATAIATDDHAHADASSAPHDACAGEWKKPLWTPRVASREQAAVDPQSGPALVYHRSVAPMAPVHSMEKKSGHSRPVTLILAALILMVVLLAAAVWGDGYRPGRESLPPPWTKEVVPVKEQTTAAAVPNP